MLPGMKPTALFCAVLFSYTASHSQQSNPLETRTRVDLVRLTFTVTDKQGKFVKDLRQEQFKILDNNVPPKELIHFEAQTDLPVRLGLLIEASNSNTAQILAEKRAAKHFLQASIRPESDRALILAFDEVPDITQDFSNDLEKLAKGVENIRPGSGTAMWDAVYYACRDKMLKERNTTPVRRAIILISSGDDKESRVLRQEAIEMALRAEVVVYAISTNLSNHQGTGDRDLQMLAEATGGRAFFLDRQQDFADAFARITDELRSQYAVVYQPDSLEANGKYRAVQIIVDNPKQRVRARKGYYAPTP